MTAQPVPEHISDERVTLAECPIGLFINEHGGLCLKTEYGNNEGRIDAYIVSSGEFFWGRGPATIATQRAQLVTPVPEPALTELQHRREAEAGARFVHEFTAEALADLYGGEIADRYKLREYGDAIRLTVQHAVEHDRRHSVAPPPAVAAGGVTEALEQARKFIADDFGDASDAHDILAVIDAALAVGDEGIREGWPEHASPLPWTYHRKNSGMGGMGSYDWIEDAHGNTVVEHVGHIDGPAIVAAVNRLVPTPPSRGEGE